MKCIACTVYHRMFCMMTDEWERGLDDRSWPILTLTLLTWRIWWAPYNARDGRWDLTWRLKS